MTSTGTSLRQQAYDALRARIVGLDLEPGARIVERDAAAELGVSRVPLREALQLLEAEGLVVLVPRQGAMVAPFTVADVRHLFEVREAVEVPAARLAAARRTEADLAELGHRVEAATAALARGDDGAVAAQNAAFHRAVTAAAHNPLLTSLTAPLEARVQRLFHLTRGRDTREQCRDHAGVLDAIRAGDGEVAAGEYRRHILAGLEPTLAVARTWSGPAPDPLAVTRTRKRAQRARSSSATTST
ncbi:GntR family transcriptional regulator [Nocardioides zeae]|uniref:GntR family transcriptional regulator n=1 Tax=Nocardioides imazamoxiresistens TaxID=3231893 RepID=A0ABU3Q209_9ACTN|nr:GntR family transcriptional regulator [Nocardioides zeae]MDT9595176.1 GntR family transcriptional regulator [Nocardioides zeae]